MKYKSHGETLFLMAHFYVIEEILVGLKLFHQSQEFSSPAGIHLIDWMALQQTNNFIISAVTWNVKFTDTTLWDFETSVMLHYLIDMGSTLVNWH